MGCPIRSTCNNYADETKFSTAIRVSAVAASALVILIGALALIPIQGLAQLGIPGGSCMVVAGLATIAIACALKCVHTNIRAKEHGLVDTDNLTPDMMRTADQEIQEGIVISDEAVEQLTRLMPKLRQRHNDPEITWYPHANDLTFSVSKAPDLVFKMNGRISLISKKGPTLSPSERFDKMVKAQALIEVNHLNHLEVPHGKLIEINGDTLLAEQKLDFKAHQYEQEKVYYDLANELDEELTQLTTFICLSRLDCVEFRKLPILNGTSKKVALINVTTTFEDKDGGKTGIIGDWPRRSGLIEFLFNERQIDLVLKKACDLGTLTADEAKEAKDKRMKQLHDLNQFYQKKGSHNDDKPIVIDDLEKLGLDLNETAQVYDFITKMNKTVTMREAVLEIVEYLNEKLKDNASKEWATHRKRNIDLSDQLHNKYRWAGTSGSVNMTEEEAKRLWLPRIFDALLTHKYLGSIEKHDGSFAV